MLHGIIDLFIYQMFENLRSTSIESKLNSSDKIEYQDKQSVKPTPVSYQVIEDGVWKEYFKPNRKEELCYSKDGSQFVYNRYKMHISIHPKDFALVEKEINQVLQKAVSDQVIPAYKVLVFENTKGKNIDRVQNIPFTIYLPNQYDDKQLRNIIELCQQIETILQKENVSVGNEAEMGPADVKLPGHFTFRQTALKTNPPYEYLDAFDETAAKELKQSALESGYFKFLEKALMDFRPFRMKLT